MSFWEYIPGADILYHLTKRPKGISPHDYAGFACTADECRAIPPAAILKCKKAIAVQAAKWVAEWIGISTAADAIKVIAGAIITAYFGATGVGAGVGVALVAIGMVDVSIVQSKANDILKASVTAMGIYCVCGWEGPAPPG